MDGSSEIKLAEDGDCGEKLMCTAMAGILAGKKICLDEKYHCDNFVQCEDASDEDNCEEEYLWKGIFTHNDRHRCQNPYLETKNKTGKFFPMRASRCVVIFTIIIIIFNSMSIFFIS